MEALHVPRTGNGMVDRTAGGKHRVPVFIGENANPWSRNDQEAGNGHSGGTYGLSQTALIDHNVGTGQPNQHQRGYWEGDSLCQVRCAKNKTSTKSRSDVGHPFVGH
jgi:hypothetical protein